MKKLAATKGLPGIATACLMLGHALVQAQGQAAQNEPNTGGLESLKAVYWGIYMLMPLPFLIIGLIAYLLYRSNHKGRKRRRKPQWVE
jgi:hypothetical protein